MLECVTLQDGTGYECICQKILDRILKGYPSHIGQNCEQHACVNTSHSAYVATNTESNGAKIDGF